jgi:hypothetical protein
VRPGWLRGHPQAVLPSLGRGWPAHAPNQHPRLPSSFFFNASHAAPLRRVPRRALPPGARRACGGVLHPRRVEGRAPALLVVPSELKVIALARHPDCDAADAGPGVQPGAERPEGAVVGRAREPGEAECCSQELAALVEHVLLDHLVRPQEQCLRDREAESTKPGQLQTAPRARRQPPQRPVIQSFRLVFAY